MAGELKHKTVGTEYTQAELEAIDRHEALGSAAGDILVFDGTYYKHLVDGDAIGSAIKGLGTIFLAADGTLRNQSGNASLRLNGNQLTLTGALIYFSGRLVSSAITNYIDTHSTVGSSIELRGYGSGAYVKHAAINPDDFGLYNGKLYGAFDVNGQTIDGFALFRGRAGANAEIKMGGATRNIEFQNSGGTPQAILTETAFQLVNPTITGGLTQDASLPHAIARGTYDFGVDGGAVSTIGLHVTIPDNAIIVKAWLEVLTTLHSPTTPDAATISIDIPVDDVAGIVAAIAINDGTNPWDAGYHACIQDGTVAGMSVKTTAARELSMTIGVEALDAGKFILWAEYIVSD